MWPVPGLVLLLPVYFQVPILDRVDLKKQVMEENHASMEVWTPSIGTVGKLQLLSVLSDVRN